MRDLDVLLLRVTAGGLLAAHGAQKLFGVFEGPGMKGTAGMMEHLGLKPPMPWAVGAAAGEFGGGMLTALGLFHPLGSIGAISAMGMAIGKVHMGKPIWVSKGGAELPLLYLTAALAVGLAGPGKYSLDEAFDIHLPAALSAIAAVGAGAALAYGLATPPPAQDQSQQGVQSAA